VTDSGGSVTSASAYTVLPGLGVTPSAVGPPTTVVTLYYSGFGALEPIDLYFDTGDVALSSASASGAGNIPLTIPAAAHPGVHWITAVGRRSVNSAQISFNVRSSWPQFGFTPNHRSKNSYENVLSTATVGSLDEAWQTPAFSGVLDTPAVVNGIVYLGFYDGTIRAFDETTGAQKWSYQTGEFAGYSSPAVSNGIVYAGSGDTYLYALDAVTGALKWRFATGNQIYSSPNVVNGIVYFGSYDSKVYALNATTGALIWSYATAGVVFSSPMVANGIVYVGSDDSKVYALNAATGALLWSYAATEGVFSSPAIVAGLVCVGSDDGIMYALHSLTGSLAWSYKTGAAIESSAATVGGAVFFGSADGNVYCLSSGGVLRWSTALPGAGGFLSPLCVANGVVYASNSSYTYAMDQNTGALLTTLPGGNVYGGPVVVNGALFVGDNNNDVLTRFTLNAALSNFVAPRPDPMQLRQRKLR
jgi:outer membrane protein assembly factor BamB